MPQRQASSKSVNSSRIWRPISATRCSNSCERSIRHAARTIIGFVPVDGAIHDDIGYNLPVTASISSDQIGGPSAGLAFTLTMIDELTPGDITGGHKIAATGAINLDGSVGDIGGLHQKTVAVKSAGAD